MPADEIRVNIANRRDKIFLLMEELRRLRIQQRLRVRARVVVIFYVAIVTCHVVSCASALCTRAAVQVTAFVQSSLIVVCRLTSCWDKCRLAN
jgi:hypothetical protein